MQLVDSLALQSREEESANAGGSNIEFKRGSNGVPFGDLL